MIQAGTIRTGSGCTVSVVGVYWMSSISLLRYTTLPGVVARSLPTLKVSVPTGGRPLAARSQSSTKFQNPRTRFCPASALRLAQDLGVCQDEVRRGEDVEHLTERELEHSLMVSRDAAHAQSPRCATTAAAAGTSGG